MDVVKRANNLAVGVRRLGADFSSISNGFIQPDELNPPTATLTMTSNIEIALEGVPTIERRIYIVGAT